MRQYKFIYISPHYYCHSKKILKSVECDNKIAEFTVVYFSLGFKYHAVFDWLDSCIIL